MKTAVYFCLAIVFIACIMVGGFILHGPREKEIWTTLAALLAVIAAAIAVLPAMRVLALQEEALRPRPTPYFDLTSRHNLLQLRVKNLGTEVAYDVQLKWKIRPIDYKGNEVQSLDHISTLLPQESVSTLMGPSHESIRKFSDTRFEGECHFKDASGRRFHQKFICSVDASLKQLQYDNELPKTLRDLQDIPKELARIAEQLKSSPRRE